jgi:hypothetical protein
MYSRAITATWPYEGNLTLFARGADGGLWSRQRYTDGTWLEVQNLGGKLAQPNIAAGWVRDSAGDYELQLFYLGTDTGLRSRWLGAYATWSQEQNLGGKVLSDITSALVPGTANVQLFYVGPNNVLMSRWRNPDGSWSKEQNLGGSITSDITAVQPLGAIPSLQLFFRGTYGEVLSRLRNPDGSWSLENHLGGQQLVGGNVTAAVVQLPQNTEILQLFYVGPDTGVWSRWQNPNGDWSDEQRIGGKLTSDITAVAVPPTQILQLFYRGLDGGVWSRWRNPDGSWSKEQNLGGQVAAGSNITATQIPETEIVQLFYIGTDNSVRSRLRNPNGSWSAEQNLGGPLG